MKCAALLVLSLAATAFAQEASRVVPAPQAPSSGGIVGLMEHWKPAPLTTEFHPLTSGQKFKVAWRDSTDPSTFFFSAATAGISQLSDTHPSLGQGLRGYGKRFVTSYADYAIGYAIGEGVLPSVLHQDPRYFRKGSGGKFSRIGHAMSRSFVTYSDSGKTVFNASEIGGDALAVAVSNAYYVDDRSAHTAAKRWATYIGWDMVSNIFKEFWPDIVGKFQRK